MEIARNTVEGQPQFLGTSPRADAIPAEQNEGIDAFVTRCRDKANTCDSEESELDERIMEIVITSTPILEFQKSLLDQPKGYKIEAIVVESRKYEAVAASRNA